MSVFRPYTLGWPNIAGQVLSGGQLPVMKNSQSLFLSTAQDGLSFHAFNQYPVYTYVQIHILQYVLPQAFSRSSQGPSLALVRTQSRKSVGKAHSCYLLACYREVFQHKQKHMYSLYYIECIQSLCARNIDSHSFLSSFLKVS